MPFPYFFIQGFQGIYSLPPISGPESQGKVKKMTPLHLILWWLWAQNSFFKCIIDQSESCEGISMYLQRCPGGLSAFHFDVGLGGCSPERSFPD